MSFSSFVPLFTPNKRKKFPVSVKIFKSKLNFQQAERDGKFKIFLLTALSNKSSSDADVMLQLLLMLQLVINQVVQVD